jgi:flagellar protein FliO/FliZ
MTMDMYGRFIIALLTVVALIFVVAWVARRLGLGGRLVPVGGKRRRLAIVEVLPLDGKRRLVLLRRDGAEHLVLLGATSEVVVESGILTGGVPAADFAATLAGASS